MRSRRLKCDCCCPCEPADAMLRSDRGKECNKAHAQYLEEMSLRSMDLPKAAATSPGVTRPPVSPAQQLLSAWPEFLR